MTRLGYQIPNFTYPSPAGDEIFGKVIIWDRTGSKRRTGSAAGRRGDASFPA